MKQIEVKGFDYVLKLVFVGESGCGKTAIVNRYTDDIYIDESAATIGVDFRVKTVTVDNKRLKLTIWDTAGQERFHSISGSYYRGAQLAVMVFDVTRHETFTALPKWIDEINENFSTTNDIVKLLVGNKSDKLPRQVIRHQALQFATNQNMKYVECSALNNEGITTAFVSGLKEVLKNRELLKTTPTVVTVNTLKHLEMKTGAYSCC